MCVKWTGGATRAACVGCREGEWAQEAWQQVYGRHSGNEIYHIQLSRSIFFHKFEGKPFASASAAVHQK